MCALADGDENLVRTEALKQTLFMMECVTICDQFGAPVQAVPERQRGCGALIVVEQCNSLEHSSSGLMLFKLKHSLVAGDEELLVGFAAREPAFAGRLLESRFAIRTVLFHDCFDSVRQRQFAGGFGRGVGVRRLAIGWPD